jgi:DDE superfamily endonuclease
VARQKRLHLVFTPTHASWLNQIEIWFGILTHKVVRRGVFACRQELVAKIMSFIASYNQGARPFAWTYTAAPWQPNKSTYLYNAMLVLLKRMSVSASNSNRRVWTRTHDGVAGCVKKTRKRHAVRKMEVDPPESPCRGRLQTAVSCFRQKLRW